MGIEASMTRDALVEAIASLTLLEARELRTALESRLDVRSPPAPLPEIDVTSPMLLANTDPSIARQARIEVELVGAERVAAARALRERLQLRLPEVAEALKHSPAVFDGEWSLATVRALLNDLERLGVVARAEVESLE